MAAVSFRLQSESFHKLVTGCSDRVGMVVLEIVKQNLSTSFSFFSTRDLDFDGLKFILAHKISISCFCRIHLLPGIDDVSQIVYIASDWWLSHIGLSQGSSVLHLCRLDYHIHGEGEKND